MSRNANERVEVGLSSLIRDLLPPLETDSEQIAEQKHGEALELAKDILNEYYCRKSVREPLFDCLCRHIPSQDAYDIDQLADGIRTKCW